MASSESGFFWVLFTWRSLKKHPSWSGNQHMILGGLKMFVLLGSEWCHNLAHVAAARLVGKPVDAIRIIFGMPVLYMMSEHPSITPPAYYPLLGDQSTTLLLWLQGFPAPHPTVLQRGRYRYGCKHEYLHRFAALVPVPVFDGDRFLVVLSPRVSPAKRLQSLPASIKSLGWPGSAAVAFGKGHGCWL
jgi:hypothetical protein